MKKVMKVLMVVAVMVLCLNFVSAADAAAGGAGGGLIGTSAPAASGSLTNIDGAAGKVWGTVITIVRILAFAAIIFAGVRYMFASADAKADIKKQTVILVVGAAIVFAAEPIVAFIQNVAKEIFGA